ncbi:hypothetical protein BU24DRAFT_425701 [Aaosphaeria arxii CBS 175.79]|uniref:Uncharacterized protein n=1 Tax=Aaosphaeria arxii CBS 175.79 TaxID=1450172 RepID=A0A6A5XGB7_9PLEO|nr:uncharacterized protein BU24DRAFT_425701 [Aaosphaeria arxii CBS 175.79]KAF2011877.1 hypothetical protein BU24DRAFT_425701 [Aaosphaeria arxii CBS 175.79]
MSLLDLHAYGTATVETSSSPESSLLHCTDYNLQSSASNRGSAYAPNFDRAETSLAAVSMNCETNPCSVSYIPQQSLFMVAIFHVIAL